MINQAEHFKRQIQLWHDRAEMAFSQSNIELAQQALARKFHASVALAELEGTPIPIPIAVEKADVLFGAPRKIVSTQVETSFTPRFPPDSDDNAPVS